MKLKFKTLAGVFCLCLKIFAADMPVKQDLPQNKNIEEKPSSNATSQKVETIPSKILEKTSSTSTAKKEKKIAPKKVVVKKKIVAKKASSHHVPSIKSIKKEPLSNEKLIILDAGHGGYDLGCQVGSCHEKSLALSTILSTKKYLTEMGYRVILTRSRDVFLTLKKRTEIANETKSKLFISIHYNSAKNPEANGIEVFYYKSADQWRSKASKNLATQVLEKMVDKTGAKNRGVKEGNFFVIRETLMPAILVEGGFITHDEERALLKDSQYRDKIAKAIADGIDHYFSI